LPFAARDSSCTFNFFLLIIIFWLIPVCGSQWGGDGGARLIYVFFKSLDIFFSFDHSAAEMQKYFQAICDAARRDPPETADEHLI
jgi:hypothetical protein